MNYNSKNEVIVDYIKILYAVFAEELRNKNSRDTTHDVMAFFSYWKRNKEVLYLLDKSGLFPILLDEFENLIGETDLFDFHILVGYDVPMEQKHYVTSAIAAMLWRVLKEWKQNGMPEKPETIAILFSRLIV